MKRKRRTFQGAALLLFLSVFFLGADNGDRDRDERAVLRDLQQTLQDRIDVLRREQDYLLFQKTMYCTDSKYLILNITEKRGELRYKNRVLKDFKFTLSKNFPGVALRPGMLVLTRKAEGKNDRHALVFGTSFIVQWRRAAVPSREADIPVLTITRMEMLSVFYAVEEGAPVYLLR